MRRYNLIILLLTFITLTLTSPAAAQENLTLELQVGFDSFYKRDTWTPVRVTISNQGSDQKAELQLLDNNTGYNTSNILYVYPVDLPAGSRKQFVFYMPLRGQPRFEVKLVDETGQTLLTQDKHIATLEPDDYLIGVLANDASLLNPLAQFNSASGGRVVVAHLKVEDLPPTPQAWNGLDMLIINNIDTSPLTPAQQDAINSWVQHGGYLLVGGGPNASQTIAGLSDMLSFSNVSVQNLAHPLQGLQNFIPLPFDDRGPYIAAIPHNPTGRILATENNMPLIIEAGWGQGRVYYIALDFTLAPLDKLAGKLPLFGNLSQQFQPQQYNFSNATARNMYSSLAQIPGQTLPTPLTVSTYLIVYILVLGPINYFVLGFLKRREWAWFTIPLIILLFSAYGYFSGFRLRQGRTLLRQITVIQSNIGAPLAYLDSYIGVYSPFRADYSLTIKDNPVMVEPMPDSYGINNQLTAITENYTIVNNLRSDIGGIPGVIVHSHTTPLDIKVDLDYNPTNHYIKGSITNNTGQPISHAQIVSADQILMLNTLPPGQTSVADTTSTLESYRFYQALDFTNDPQELSKLASRDIAAKAVLGLDNNWNHLPDILDGVYLIGWQEGSPLAINLNNNDSDQMTETLLLIELPVEINN